MADIKQLIGVGGNGRNILHLAVVTETHCHVDSPLLCQTCEWFRFVCARGQEGSKAGWELSLFEVGIWSSHLHLMSFRLLVLTRAKHLTGLGLIWWGHGVTPWPSLSLSVFTKWNQLNHRGIGRGVEKGLWIGPKIAETHLTINLGSDIWSLWILRTLRSKESSVLRILERNLGLFWSKC